MSGGFSGDAMREQFWARFIARLDGSGFRSWQQRGNFCYLWFPRTHSARVVVVAGTRDHRLACKLDVLKGRSVGSGDPVAAMHLLREQRDVIEAELGLGALGWGGQSSTRIYLYREAMLGDRRTWSDAIDWLVRAATRFKEVFEPRLLEIAPVLTATRRPRRGPASDQVTIADAPDTKSRRMDGTSCEPERSSPRIAPQSSGRAKVDWRAGHSIEQAFERLGEMFGLFMEKPYDSAWALLSPAGPDGKRLYRYVYALWWDKRREPSLRDTVAWVLCNPLEAESTESRQRQTLWFCRAKTREWNQGGLVIINLFAYRANTSDELPSLQQSVAVGPVNDQTLEAISQRCAISVAAWGNRGALYNRSQEVRRLITDLQCVTDPTGKATTNRGEPFHPSRRPKLGVLTPLL